MPLSQVEPARYDTLLAEKVERVRALLAPYHPPTPEVFSSPTLGYRMRAEFRVWHDGDALDYVMFRPEDRKTPVPITHFPIACDAIRSLMPALITQLRGQPLLRRKLFQVEFLSTLSGDTLVTLVYHRRLEDDWDTAAAELASLLDISIVGRSRRQKRVIGLDYVVEELPVNEGIFRYRQYEQAFTQPNARVNTRMIEWACRQASGLPGNLLELYCGNGNFTLPLAACFEQLIATELSKRSVKAARENLELNGIGNVEIIRLAAEEVSQAMLGEREFRRLAHLPRALPDYDLQSLFVDPPRAGLDDATVHLAAAFPAILYISCNPETLAANLAVLCESHSPEAFALFDQFPYTDHMECGVLLTRRRMLPA
jgi:tRNA (uracil-5-)-methyltransferase